LQSRQQKKARTPLRGHPRGMLAGAGRGAWAPPGVPAAPRPRPPHLVGAAAAAAAAVAHANPLPNRLWCWEMVWQARMADMRSWQELLLGMSPPVPASVARHFCHASCCTTQSRCFITDLQRARAHAPAGRVLLGGGGACCLLPPAWRGGRSRGGPPRGGPAPSCLAPPVPALPSSPTHAAGPPACSRHAPHQGGGVQGGAAGHLGHLGGRGAGGRCGGGNGAAVVTASSPGGMLRVRSGGRRLPPTPRRPAGTAAAPAPVAGRAIDPGWRGQPPCTPATSMDRLRDDRWGVITASAAASRLGADAEAGSAAMARCRRGARTSHSPPTEPSHWCPPSAARGVGLAAGRLAGACGGSGARSRVRLKWNLNLAFASGLRP